MDMPKQVNRDSAWSLLDQVDINNITLHVNIFPFFIIHTLLSQASFFCLDKGGTLNMVVNNHC